MKRYIQTLIALFTASFCFAQTQLPFSKGVNLSSWFEIWNKGNASYRLYNRKDFADLKELGVEIVRVPVHFENQSSGKPDYIINPLVFEYLDKACDWAEELGLYLVIDNHSYNGRYRPSKQELERHLLSVWNQVAQHYKDRSSYIIYEILNEPNEITSADWNSVQGKVLKAIRKIDTKHTVVVTGADWGGAGALEKTAVYNDDNLIYTFHFYSPMMFTHQGAGWSNEYLKYLSNIPFPYDKNRMPVLPSKYKDEYAACLVSGYPHDATEKAVRQEIEIARNFSVKHKVPVWCGELGVYNKTAPAKDRENWYKMVSSILREYNIPYTVWDYKGSFGVYNKNSFSIYPYDLNPEVTKALGFNVSELTGKTAGKPETEFPFIIYDDFNGKNISFWADKCFNTSYDKDKAEGYCSIAATNVKRYNSITWKFAQGIDLSRYDLSKIKLSLKIKFTKPNQCLDLRFTNPEKETQLPWRMTKQINSNSFELNQWVTLTVRLCDMQDTGAWSVQASQWYPSRNEFNLTDIAAFCIVPESNDLHGTVYIDDIKIILE